MKDKSILSDFTYEFLNNLKSKSEIKTNKSPMNVPRWRSSKLVKIIEEYPTKKIINNPNLLVK